MTMLKIRCAWCGEDMGEKDGQGAEGTTDSICPKCSQKVIEDAEIADNMRSYWANQNAGSANWRG